MIHNAEKKIIILDPPKTGSSTIRYIFNRLLIQSVLDTGDTSILSMPGVVHAKYSDILKTLPDINLDEYTIYSFYREPVARFMSTFKYFQKQLLTDFNVRAQNGDADHLKLIYKALYNDEDITRDPNSITVDDIISIIDTYILGPQTAPVLDLFRRQTLYLTDKVTLLDFDNFENNVKMLLEVYGLDINTPIPKHNDTNSADYLSDLTEEQITKIKEIYAGDYAFFESHNITF